MKVFEIIIDEFKFTPIGIQFLTDVNILIILYNLQYKNIQTIIPYYVSNGHTNELRANLVFPFLCVSVFNEYPTCPIKISKSKKHLLVKYQIIENVNLDPIETYMNEKFKDYKDQLKIRYDKNLSGGLDTVITRLKNIIDFIICVCYINLKRDPKKYRPVFIPKHELNMDYIEDDSELTIKDEFRQELIKYLKDFYTNFIKLDFIKINEYTMEKYDLSTNDFNEQPFIRVCSDKEYKNTMIKNYAIISEEFRKWFIYNITLLNSPTYFLNLCNYMFSKETIDNNLDTIMKQFNLECPSPKSPRRSRSPRHSRSPRRSKSPKSPRK